MATKCSIATGNLLTGSTFATVDATSFLDSQAANTVLTTSYQTSSTFTPGAITTDGILLKVALRVGTTGTMTVALDIAGVDVPGTIVTINVSDIHAGDTAANNGCGWYCFKFASPVLLVGATVYGVKAKTSSATQVNLYSSATTNWSRGLRTTTTGAPGAADTIIIAGEWTAAATSSSFTVTMDETATTSYGTITVNNKGTLSSGVVASTAYNLKTAGKLRVFGGGTLNFGTSGAKMPSTSSMTLTLACVSAGDYGIELQNGSTFNAYGNPLSFVKTKLAADASTSATALTTTDSTGWLNGDVIVLPSTTRTYTQAESKAMGANASGTSIGTIAALTNAHGGNSTTGVQADIGNLTRNVKINGTSASVTGYILIRNGATVNMQYVEMSFLGTNTTDKHAWDLQTAASGSTNISYCSLYSSTVASADAIYISGSTANNITLDNNILYSLPSIGVRIATATSGASIVVTNNLIVGMAGFGAQLADNGITFSNNILTSGASVGLYPDESNVALGTFSGNSMYSNNSYGMYLTTALTGGTISNSSIWRNNNFGIHCVINYLTSPLIIDTASVFGNVTAGINFETGLMSGLFNLKNITFWSGSSLTQAAGLRLASTILNALLVQDCSFGSGSTHATGDVQITANSMVIATFHNCLFASSTQFATYTSQVWAYDEQRGIASMKHHQVAGDHRLYTKYGLRQTDTAIYNAASPSERMTPNSASVKLRSSSQLVAVNSGATCAVTAGVRKSVVGDGTAYNGSQPRLMVRACPFAGITNDTVLATAAGAAGSWETLSGITVSVTADCVLEFFVDCDGTTGWVNVDD